MTNLLLACDRILTRIAVGLACLLLVLAAVFGLYQVLTRFLLQEPSTWSEVLVRTLLIWMVYLGCAGAFRQGALVAVDVLYVRTTGRARAVFDWAVTLMVLAFLGIALWFGIEMTWRVRFQNLAGLEISIAWAYAAIPVGAGFAILAVLAHHFDPKRRQLENAL